MDAVIQQFNTLLNGGQNSINQSFSALPIWATILMIIGVIGFIVLCVFLVTSIGELERGLIFFAFLTFVFGYGAISVTRQALDTNYPYTQDMRQQLTSAIESEYKLKVDTSKDNAGSLFGPPSHYNISEGLSDIKSQLKNEHVPLNGVEVTNISSSVTETYRVYIVNDNVIWNLCARNSNGDYVVLDKGGNAINQLKELG